MGSTNKQEDEEDKSRSDSERASDVEDKKSHDGGDGANNKKKGPVDVEGAPVIPADENFNGDDLKDDIAFVTKMGIKRYITFAEFAKKMSLFNPRTDIEDKIHFYFRIFDVDEDKKIKK